MSKSLGGIIGCKYKTSLFIVSFPINLSSAFSLNQLLKDAHTPNDGATRLYPVIHSYSFNLKRRHCEMDM